MVMSVSVHIVCGIHIIYYVHNGVQSCAVFIISRLFVLVHAYLSYSISVCNIKPS